MTGAKKERPESTAGGTCWVCGSDQLDLAKNGNLDGGLNPDRFEPTDERYGVTADIYRCRACGFLQCSGLGDVLPFYEQMADQDYEDGREQRSLQQFKLLRRLARFRPSGRLLDIGAGAGMLVEQAQHLGYDALGVEPSVWFHQQAVKLNLPVALGTFPHPEAKPPFDAITMVDIIEHVTDPLGLLIEVRRALADDGVGLVVTPDPGSLAARIMGWKWWHYRVAHIGYFGRRQLLDVLKRAGLRPLAVKRPGWYFTADYLIERVKRYLPDWLPVPNPNFLKKIVVPLNLYDSLLVIFAKD